MAKKKHTKESIIQTLQNLAKKLGKNTLSKADINTHLSSILSLSSIIRYFGSVMKKLDKSTG
jgi:hypothetical protein